MQGFYNNCFCQLVVLACPLGVCDEICEDEYIYKCLKWIISLPFSQQQTSVMCVSLGQMRCEDEV